MVNSCLRITLKSLGRQFQVKLSMTFTNYFASFLIAFILATMTTGCFYDLVCFNLKAS